MSIRCFRLRYEDTTLYFGPNSINNIKEYLRQFENLVIVTGKSSAKISGALNDVEKILKDLGIGYTLYDNVSPNPWASQAEGLADLIRSEGAEAVIAIGGGSPIDAAKIGIVLAANGGKVVDYLVGKRKIKRSLPLVAVNLTHGTGTEIDRHAVITIDETKEKTGLSTKHPDLSIDDPRYTITLDKEHSIYTSLDAFYHAYEAATANNANAFVEMTSEEAIRIIVETLPTLVGNLNSLELRYKMLYASMVAGIAIDMSPAHIIHVIEHVISGLEPRVAHGCGLAMLGPRAVYYIHKAAPEVSSRLLKNLNQNLKPLQHFAEEASKTVAKFQEAVGFSKKLSDYGFSEKDVKTIVDRVLRSLDYLQAVTPFKVTEDTIADIVRHAL